MNHTYLACCIIFLVYCALIVNVSGFRFGSCNVARCFSDCRHVYGCIFGNCRTATQCVCSECPSGSNEVLDMY